MYTKYSDFTGQPKQMSKIWKAALYIRLSKEDGDDKAESYSVTSQRAILMEFLKLHPDIELFDVYIDDGWSGTNFDRPDFNRMMDDIYKGRVDCVIVKDLSRFGRNYTDCGYYLDDVFVKLQVRFIALNNGVDSASNNMNAATRCITVGVQNVINESIAATTSVNVRGTLNVSREQGKFIGSFPTYGYLKDPNDHHKLIIDEETAPVVRQIFEWFLGGKSIIGISKELNESGIPNPTAYKKMKGFNYKHNTGDSGTNFWSDTTVRRILSNQMYIGDMVQGKNTTISYKINKCRAIPKEDWIIVPGTHEAVIDKEIFYRAQSLFNRGIRKPPKKNDVDLFSGFLRCGDCLRSMNKKTNIHSYGTYHYYRCITARKLSKSACTNHTIRADKLEQAVLVTIQKMSETATELAEIVEKIDSSSERHKESTHLEKSLKAYEAEKEKCLRLQVELYPDWKNGLISKEEYIRLKDNIQEKLNSYEDKIQSIRKTITNFQDGILEENTFLQSFKKYGVIEKLTRPLLLELVERILIFEGGKIEVVFKFQDAYEEVLEYIEMNKEAV